MQNISSPSSMSMQELRTISVLAGVMAVRMLGLFLILPVLSLFARELSGTTPFLVGISVGIYGLAQAGLQLLFGVLSDRYGRKPLVLIGLATLVAGSLLAAVSHSIYMLILARALQGAGAIGSTILAWVADVTAPQQRTKAMAILGGVIGSSFALSLVLGSLVNSFTGPRGVFTATALLAAAGLLLVTWRLPNSKTASLTGTPLSRPPLGDFFRDPLLARLYLCAFVLHGILAAVFVVLPVLLTQTIHLQANHQWFFYLGVILTAFAIVLPQIRNADTQNKHGWLMLAAIIGMTSGIFILTLSAYSLWSLTASMVLFFSGFAMLEALLPALVSRLAPAQWKGTTLSIYGTLQFLGIFIGGGLGGLLFTTPGDTRLFLSLTVVGCLWFGLLFPLRKKLSSQPR
jgi:MFS family permease